MSVLLTCHVAILQFIPNTSYSLIFSLITIILFSIVVTADFILYFKRIKTQILKSAKLQFPIIDRGYD
jgi:hypothetical protein